MAEKTVWFGSSSSLGGAGSHNQNEVWGLLSHLCVASDSPVRRLIKSWTVRPTVEMCHEGVGD